MPGPLPKDPAIRQHRIKHSTRAALNAETHPITRMPSLPECPGGEQWHRMAKRFWRDVWHSPMSDKYLRADMHGLFRLLILVDAFWKGPSESLSREIRLLGQLYGLSPIDRRRLQWTVEEEAAVERKRTRQPAVEGEARADDPRKILQMVASR